MKDLAEGIRDAIYALEHDGKPLEVAAALRELVAAEVLPCPCCGTEPEMIDVGRFEKQLRCPECCLMSGIGPVDIVVNAWNKRVDHE